MSSKTLRIGIISRDDYFKRVIAIGSGERKRRPGEPKIWFESLNSLAQVLSNENRELLRLIDEHKPQSLAELENLSKRRKSNLSRTLKTLERFGIVELPLSQGKMAPIVKATDFQVEFGLG